MADTLALEKLFDDVTLAFGRAAVVATIAGTSLPTLEVAPAAAHVVELEITTGGTVGTDGIFYRTRVDAGAWSSPAALGTADEITAGGATVSFGAGTLLAGDAVTLTLTTSHTFGWREDNRVSPRPNRIVWKPGNDGDDVGKLLPPKYPGRTPARPLATLADLFSCTITAYDSSAPESERAQWKACRLLFDEWFRCVYVSAYGTFRIESAKWIRATKERGRGAAIRVVGVIESMIPDEESESAPTDTSASVDHQLLDVSEIELIEAES